MKNFSVTITKKGMMIFFLMLLLLGFNHVPVCSAQYTTSMNAEVKFIVYPDGTLKVSSEGIYTVKYPFTIVNPSVEAKLQFNKILSKYNVLSNMTITLPPDQAETFPFNATTATINMQCSNNITTTTLDVSLILCDSFSGIDFNSFPFNSTDLSVSADYANQQFNGTIIIHLIPGLTLGDIHLNFEGNLTQVTISDSVKVFYNYTLPITGVPEINEETLNAFLMMLNSTIPGTGPGSLYASTKGMLTCTTFNTIITPIDANSAKVSFLVVIKGDFIRLLANLFMGGGFDVPLYQMDLYPLINATAHLIKNIEFSVSYSKSAKTLIVHSIFVQNLTEYASMSTEILLGMYPPELKPYIQSLLNTTYISLYSSTEKISYSGGKVTYNGNYTISGDLNAQINFVKNIYVDMLNAINPGPSWIKNAVKNTSLDIANLKLSLSTNGTSQSWNFEDAVVMPPVNRINASSFKFADFFNITSTLPGGVPEPPTSNDVLKLIVQGESNGTHTVTIHIDQEDPQRIPEPDEFLGGNTMVWHNQSISKLKSLIFRVWEGKTETIYNTTSITPNNPYIINVKQEANCILTINSISKPTSINIKNATAPDSAPSGTYKLLGTCVQISSSEDIAINATIRIYYTLEQLSALGLDENTLKIFYFDTTSNQWKEVETQINKVEHYAQATVNHLSLWAVFGQPPTSLWQEWWLLAAIAIIAITVIIIAGLALLKRKQAKPK